MIHGSFLWIQRLVSVGMDQHATINVWDWKKGKIIATARGHSDKVSHQVLIFNELNLLQHLSRCRVHIVESVLVDQ